MASTTKPILIATRGSALALAQAHLVFDHCRKAFPRLSFEIKIVTTKGDKQQTASLANPPDSLPKGLFTRELEVALLKHRADLAVHSLKDLPTELPAGLVLGAVTRRADVRDVLIYRDAEYLRAESEKEHVAEWAPGHAQRRGLKLRSGLADLPSGATVATSSTRRRAQLLAQRADLNVVEIRGNVVTRLQKLADRPEFDGLILAAAGLARLNFEITRDGRLQGDAVPDGLLATTLEPEVMLPCVGQGALGIEIRDQDERILPVCQPLNHFNTRQCVTAERAFLRQMGGGCQSPVAAYGEVVGDKLRLRAVSFRDGACRRAEGQGDLKEPVALGEQLAAELKPKPGTAGTGIADR
jgi:porphobilinogen deaminase